MTRSTTWTVDAVRALGTTTDVVTAGEILGIGRTSAYQLARDGEFPVPVTRVGRRFIVGIPHLLHAIGATEATGWPASAPEPWPPAEGQHTGGDPRDGRA